MGKVQEHRIRRTKLAEQIIDQITRAMEEDALHEMPAANRWYFVTPDEMFALKYYLNRTAREPIKSLTDIYGYEIMITTDLKKTGRQRDAMHLISIIDTYPDYPRILP